MSSERKYEEKRKKRKFHFGKLNGCQVKYVDDHQMLCQNENELIKKYEFRNQMTEMHSSSRATHIYRMKIYRMSPRRWHRHCWCRHKIHHSEKCKPKMNPITNSACFMFTTTCSSFLVIQIATKNITENWIYLQKISGFISNDKLLFYAIVRVLFVLISRRKI